MDIEQLLTLILILTFSAIFFYFACRIKCNIEKRYREDTEKLKHSKKKINEISIKQTILCKKVLGETTNRHQQSIVASSLKQTLDEELEKIHHITDSIQLVKQIPDLKPSFHHFKEDIFPDFDGLSVLSLGSSNANSDPREKFSLRGKDSRIQTKLWKTWGPLGENLKNNDETFKKQRKRKWNETPIKNNAGSHFHQTKSYPYQALTNIPVYNANIINFKDDPRSEEDLNKVNNGSSVGKNDSVKASPKTIEDQNKNSFYKSYSNSLEKQGYQTKQKNLHSCPESQSPSYYRSNNEWELIKSESTSSTNTDCLERQCKVEQNIFVENTVSCKKINCDTKSNGDKEFQFDLIHCNENETAVKILIDHKNNISLLSHTGMEECLKVVGLKVVKVCPKKDKEEPNTFVRYIFKISLKVHKKKVVMKCVFSCINKEKHDFEQVDHTPKQKYQSYKTNSADCSRVQSMHSTLSRKPRKKRHSLYTNTSVVPIEKRHSNSKGKLYPTVLSAEGDVSKTSNDNNASFTLHYTGENNQCSDQGEKNNVSILKQCIELTKDYSKDFHNGFTQQTYQMTRESEMLPSIEEEENDNCKECGDIFMRTEDEFTNSTPLLEKPCHHKAHEELIVPYQGKETRKHEPSLENNLQVQLYRNKSKTLNEMQTNLNLKAVQILDKISAGRLKENLPPHDFAQAQPTKLTCIFELKSFNETLFVDMPNGFLNPVNARFHNGESVSARNTLRNRQLALTNANTVFTGIKSGVDPCEDSQIVACERAVNNLQTVNVEEIVVEPQTRDSFVMEKSIFINNEFDEFSLSSQNRSSTLLIMEGALLTSTDDSRTFISDEMDSQIDLIDTEYESSITSNSS